MFNICLQLLLCYLCVYSRNMKCVKHSVLLNFSSLFVVVQKKMRGKKITLDSSCINTDFSSSQSERSLSQGCFFCPPPLKRFKSPRAFSLVSPSHLYLAPTRQCRHKADLFTLITKPRWSVLRLLFHPRTMLFNLKCLLGSTGKECFRRTKKNLRKTECIIHQPYM